MRLTFLPGFPSWFGSVSSIPGPHVSRHLEAIDCDSEISEEFRSEALSITVLYQEPNAGIDWNGMRAYTGLLYKTM